MVTDDMGTCAPNPPNTPILTYSTLKNILQFVRFVFHVLFLYSLKSHIISMYIKLYKENKASQAL